MNLFFYSRLFARQTRWLACPIVLVALLVILPGCIPEDITGYDFKQHQPPLPPSEVIDYVRVGQVALSSSTLDVFIRRGAHSGFNAVRVVAAEGVPPSLRFLAARGSTPMPEAPQLDAQWVETDEGWRIDGGVFFLPTQRSTPEAFRLGIQAVGSSTTQWIDVEAALIPRHDVAEMSGGRVHISWVEPGIPTVGQDVLTMWLHREVSGTFTALEGAVFGLYPYMDMGGGDGHSTPFTLPTDRSGGRYVGEINFIMSGAWDLSGTIGLTSETVPFAFDGFTVYP